MTQARFYSSLTKRTTTTADPGISGTTLTVVDTTSFASLDGSTPYTLLINWGLSDQEVVNVTARPSSTTFTTVRGQDGSTGQAHAIGATIDHGVSARDFTEAGAHVGASSGVHGVTGAVVGTTNTQVFSNKSTSDSFSVGGDLTVSGVGQTITRIKPANETVTSSTTLQDDNDLTMPIVANATYIVTGAMQYEAGTTGDLALKWVVPAGASLVGILSGLISTAASDLDNYASGLDAVNTKSVGGRGAGAGRAANFQGSLVVGATGGTFKLQWAQLATDTISTILYTGSFMMLQRVA